MINIFEDKPKFRPMYKGEVQELKSKLEELHRMLTMNSSHFHEIGMGRNKVHSIPETDVTDFIRRRTKNWRETWVLHPLNKLIARCDDCLNGVSIDDRDQREREESWGVRS